MNNETETKTKAILKVARECQHQAQATGCKHIRSAWLSCATHLNLVLQAIFDLRDFDGHGSEDGINNRERDINNRDIAKNARKKTSGVFQAFHPSR